MLKNCHSKPNICRCLRHDDEQIVQNHLSVTPAELEDMVSRGVPVSHLNLRPIETDGTEANDFFISPERRRSVDPMTDTYNVSMDVRSKAKRNMPFLRSKLVQHRVDENVPIQSTEQKGGD